MFPFLPLPCTLIIFQRLDDIILGLLQRHRGRPAICAGWFHPVLCSERCYSPYNSRWDGRHTVRCLRFGNIPDGRTARRNHPQPPRSLAQRGGALGAGRHDVSLYQQPVILRGLEGIVSSNREKGLHSSPSCSWFYMESVPHRRLPLLHR